MDLFLSLMHTDGTLDRPEDFLNAVFDTKQTCLKPSDKKKENNIDALSEAIRSVGISATETTDVKMESESTLKTTTEYKNWQLFDLSKDYPVTKSKVKMVWRNNFGCLVVNCGRDLGSGMLGVLLPISRDKATVDYNEYMRVDELRLFQPGKLVKEGALCIECYQIQNLDGLPTNTRRIVGTIKVRRGNVGGVKRVCFGTPMKDTVWVENDENGNTNQTIVTDELVNGGRRAWGVGLDEVIAAAIQRLGV